MTFSYTDDAIVSTSPTGRHLSNVIKRPVVLMSGWNEHAEAVCKVLNESTAASSIGGTIGTLSYQVDPEPSLAELIAEGYFKPVPADVLGLNWPKAYDFSALEARATPEQVRKCEGREDFKTLRKLEALAILKDALKDRDAKLAAVTAELEELQAKPVEVTADLARSLFYAVPGATYPAGLSTIKRV